MTPSSDPRGHSYTTAADFQAQDRDPRGGRPLGLAEQTFGSFCSGRDPKAKRRGYNYCGLQNGQRRNLDSGGRGDRMDRVKENRGAQENGTQYLRSRNGPIAKTTFEESESD